MYVCLCTGVTDGKIRDAIYEGCCSYREVREATGVASQCGKCACLAKQVVRETLTSLQASQAAWVFQQNFLQRNYQVSNEPDLTSGFFMPKIQVLRAKTRNTNILIPINFHLLFKHLGLTVVNTQIKLCLIYG